MESPLDFFTRFGGGGEDVKRTFLAIALAQVVSDKLSEGSSEIESIPHVAVCAGRGGSVSPWAFEELSREGTIYGSQEEGWRINSSTAAIPDVIEGLKEVEGSLFQSVHDCLVEWCATEFQELLVGFSENEEELKAPSDWQGRQALMLSPVGEFVAGTGLLYRLIDEENDETRQHAFANHLTEALFVLAKGKAHVGKIARIARTSGVFTDNSALKELWALEIWGTAMKESVLHPFICEFLSSDYSHLSLLITEMADGKEVGGEGSGLLYRGAFDNRPLPYLAVSALKMTGSIPVSRPRWLFEYGDGHLCYISNNSSITTIKHWLDLSRRSTTPALALHGVDLIQVHVDPEKGRAILLGRNGDTENVFLFLDLTKDKLSVKRWIEAPKIAFGSLFKEEEDEDVSSPGSPVENEPCSWTVEDDGSGSFFAQVVYKGKQSRRTFDGVTFTDVAPGDLHGYPHAGLSPFPSTAAGLSVPRASMKGLSFGSHAPPPVSRGKNFGEEIGVKIRGDFGSNHVLGSDALYEAEELERVVKLFTDKQSDLEAKLRSLVKSDHEMVGKIFEAQSLLYDEDPASTLRGVVEIRRALSMEVNPPIQLVLDFNLVPRLVDICRTEATEVSSHTLVFEALWALSNVCSGSSDQTSAVVQQGAIPLVVSLLRHPSRDVTEQAIWCLGNIAGDCIEHRDQSLEAGALDVLVDVLSVEQGHVGMGLLRNGMWCLSNLFRNTGSSRHSFANTTSRPPMESTTAGVNFAISHLTSLDDEVLSDALWALSYFSDGEDERGEYLCATGVCPTLVSLLRHNSDAVKTPALRVVGNLTTGSQDVCTELLDSGVLVELRQLTTSPRRALRKESFWALSNIAAGVSEHVGHLVDSGVIEDAVGQLLEAEPDVRNEMIWMLSNCFSTASPDMLARLVPLGTLGALGEMLQLEDGLSERHFLVIVEGTEAVWRVEEYRELVEAIWEPVSRERKNGLLDRIGISNEFVQAILSTE